MSDNLFNREWVDAYFEHGIDIVNRRVFLDSEIDGSSVGAAVRGLYLMETQSKTEPVEIFISSYGGDLHETLALYDIMNTIRCPLHTFAYGKCMSAAPILLANGEKGQRWVAPNARFMHHDMSYGEDGTRTSIKVAVKEAEELYKSWIEALEEHTNRSYRWWDSKSKKHGDFYFSAEEAIDFGVADQIWSER